MGSVVLVLVLLLLLLLLLLLPLLFFFSFFFFEFLNSFVSPRSAGRHRSSSSRGRNQRESIFAWVPGFDVSKDVVIDIMHGLATVSKGLIHVAKGQRQPDADDEAYVHALDGDREPNRLHPPRVRVTVHRSFPTVVPCNWLLAESVLLVPVSGRPRIYAACGVGIVPITWFD